MGVGVAAWGRRRGEEGMGENFVLFVKVGSIKSEHKAMGVEEIKSRILLALGIHVGLG